MSGPGASHQVIVERFARDGYAVLPDVLNEDELARYREALSAMESRADEASEDSDRFKMELFGDSDSARRVQQIADPHEFGGDFSTLARDRRILDVVEALIGPDILLYYSMLMMKPPGTGAPAPWHQDLAFFAHDRARLVAAQVYLDDSTLANGCVRVVPGSHRLGLLNHFSGESFAGVVQGDTSEYDAAEVAIEASAGSVALWHCLTLHSSHANTSQHPRRAVVFEYKDPSTHILTGSFNTSEARQAGIMVRGDDPTHQLLSAL